MCLSPKRCKPIIRGEKSVFLMHIQRHRPLAVVGLV